MTDQSMQKSGTTYVWFKLQDMSDAIQYSPADWLLYEVGLQVPSGSKWFIYVLYVYIVMVIRQGCQQNLWMWHSLIFDPWYRSASHCYARVVMICIPTFRCARCQDGANSFAPFAKEVYEGGSGPEWAGNICKVCSTHSSFLSFTSNFRGFRGSDAPVEQSWDQIMVVYNSI